MKIFIVNPIAGNGKAIIAEKTIKENLNDTNHKFIYTDKKNNATEIASYYSKFSNTEIYCIGGDGTLNEVVNGIAISNIPIHIIPAGTGNDFVKTLSNDFKGKIDLIKVNKKYSINIVSFGLDAMVANKANELKTTEKNKSLVYLKSIIHAIVNYKSNSLTINDNKELITILTICNGKYYGGGFNISPKSKLDDGLLDLCIVKNVNKLKFPLLATELIMGIHDKNKEVHFSKIKKLRITSHENILCNIDGEIIEDKIFDINVIPNSLNIIYDDEYKVRKLLKK